MSHAFPKHTAALVLQVSSTTAQLYVSPTTAADGVAKVDSTEQHEQELPVSAALTPAQDAAQASGAADAHEESGLRQTDVDAAMDVPAMDDVFSAAAQHAEPAEQPPPSSPATVSADELQVRLTAAVEEAHALRQERDAALQQVRSLDFGTPSMPTAISHAKAKQGG